MFRKKRSSKLARLRSRHRRSRSDPESANACLYVQFPTVLNTNQLHFTSLRPGKRADEKITKNIHVLIQLILNGFRYVTITRKSESLVRNAEDRSEEHTSEL